MPAFLPSHIRMEYRTPSHYSRYSRVRDGYPTTSMTPSTGESWPSPDHQPSSRISEYAEVQQRVSNRGQVSQISIHPTQHSLISDKHRIIEPEIDDNEQDRDTRQSRYHSNNSTLHMDYQHASRASHFPNTQCPPYRKHLPDDYESHGGTLSQYRNCSSRFQGEENQTPPNSRITQYPPHLASPISWNNDRLQRVAPFPKHNKLPRYTENLRSPTSNTALQGLRDEFGTPISMSEYVFNEINSQQRSLGSPPQHRIQAASLKNRGYGPYQSSAKQSSGRYEEPVVNIPQPPSQHATQNFGGSLSHPSTPFQDAALSTSQEKFTFMDKWLRQGHIKKRARSDTKERGVVGGLPTTGMVFQERKLIPLEKKSSFNSQRQKNRESPISSETGSSVTNSTSSGSIQSPICLDTPLGTSDKSKLMRNRLPALPKPKASKLPQRRPANPQQLVNKANKIDPELARQLKAATSITKRELEMDQQDLQRAIFGEVLESEDEDERKENELQAKRDQRLRERERREQEALRAAEEKAEKIREELELAAQLAERRRLQKEREEQMKKAKREEVRKKLAAEEDVVTEQRRKATAEKILKSRAKEAVSSIQPQIAIRQ